MEAARPTLGPGMQVTKAVQLVRPLSTGGMGSVWLAEHIGLKTRVVVKFMLGELGSSETAKNRFKREAEAAAKVRSPHVVTIHDHGYTDDGVAFIVMEHLEGRDLGAELTERGKLDPRTVAVIVTQVAKALSRVHAAGLLHRDIKPDNIFLVSGDGDDEIFVKLLDFGIAKSHSAEARESTLDGETKTGQVVGTPFYMSPEQVTAQKNIDHRSDLWALGVVAYEALTGVRPFDGPSFGALAVKIATGDPVKPTESNPDLPPAMDTWFAKACAREPAARYGSAKELAEGLRIALGETVPESAVMSDSGPRAMSKSGPDVSMPPRSFTPPKSATTPDPADDSTDRPSFVLASTMEQTSKPPPSALGRSGSGMAIIPQEQTKGRSTLLYAVGIIGLVVVGAYAGMTWSGRTKPTPTPGIAPVKSVEPPVQIETPKPIASAAPSAVPDAAAVASVPTAPATTKPVFVPHPPPTRTVPTATTSARPTNSGGDPLF
jgi:serine/threonine protein kinase